MTSFDKVEEATAQKTGTLSRGILLEQISMMFMGVCLAAILLTSNLCAKYLIAALGGLSIILPYAVRTAQRFECITSDKVYSILRKRGFAPKVNNDEFRWTSDGKECILRFNGTFIELSREFNIPAIPEALEGYEKAAQETMKKLHLAKVTIHNDEDNSKLAISTEPLCTTAKEFSTFLPICLEILDEAETIQIENMKEIQDGKVEDKGHRIGFAHTDGSIR